MWTDKPFEHMEMILNGTVVNSEYSMNIVYGKGVWFILSQLFTATFSSIAFNNVSTLTLRAATFHYMPSHTFTAFGALETLNMPDVTVYNTNAGLLDTVSNTLTSFRISASPASTSLQLSNFLGGSMIQKRLLSAHFHHNLLGSTIQPTDFGCVHNLVVLNLTACGIESIAARTFDSFHLLERLILNDNRIQTIPSTLFDVILPSYHLYIYISRNPWRCDCDLCYLKTALETYWWNFDMNAAQLSEVLSCNEPNCNGKPGITTPSPAVASPVTMLPIVDPIGPPSPAPVLVEHVTLHCLTDNYPPFVVEVVKITGRNRALRIADNFDGTVNVSIRMSAVLPTTLLWFDNSDKHFQSVVPPPTAISDNCGPMTRNVNDGYTQTIIVDIRPYVPYTFCVIDNLTEALVVSPFNCMSFNKRSLRGGDDGGGLSWFTNDEKTITVVMLCVGIVLVFVFGAMLGYALFCRPCCRRRTARKAAMAAAAARTAAAALNG